MAHSQSIESRIDDLESTIEEQQELIESQQELIEELAERDEQQRARLESLQEDEAAGWSLPSVSRRTALSTVGLAGLVGLGATSGAAAPSGQVGTESRPVRELHAEDVATKELSIDTTASDVSGNGAIAINSTGGTPGVYAEVEAPGYSGLYGTNIASSGWSWGVRGDTASTVEDAFGVRGIATSGAASGVGGRTDGDTQGAAGVKGQATADAAPVKGVIGETQSDHNLASGVLGTAPGNGANGVTGLTNGTSQSDRSDEAGVYGETNGDSSYGVYGYNTATSGTNAEGVYGLTDSADSAAITGENTDGGVGVSSAGSLEVEGHTDISQVGADAYLSSNQVIDPVVRTVVAFDSTNVDHFNGFDTSTGQYTVQEPGNYHVSCTIDWQTNFSEGDDIFYDLRINDDITGGIQLDTSVGADNQRVCRSFSRTLFGLSSGDVIDVRVEHQSGDTAAIYGTNQESYISIAKLG